jgi:hypothetical protein
MKTPIIVNWSLSVQISTLMGAFDLIMVIRSCMVIIEYVDVLEKGCKGLLSSSPLKEAKGIYNGNKVLNNILLFYLTQTLFVPPSFGPQKARSPNR